MEFVKKIVKIDDSVRFKANLQFHTMESEQIESVALKLLATKQIQKI
jgi:hypothetical protein